jgi:GDSL-like Lipase/Acylhydrolase family
MKLFPGPIRAGIQANILLLLSSSAVALGMGEALVRARGWPAPGFYRDGKGPLALRAPGAAGGAFPPGGPGRLRHYDYDVACQVNADGFREREPQPKRSGEWRVALLGDSFATGMGVEESQSFLALWKRTADRAVTVWNLAAPSCGTSSEAAILHGVGARYDIDEVVVAFFGGNDLTDNLAWSRAGSGRTEIESSDWDARGWLREHSRLATFVWVGFARGFARFRPPGVYDLAEFDRLWPFTEEALASLRSAAGTRPLTIVYLPSTPEWDDHLWEWARTEYGLRDEGRFLVASAVSRWARAHGVRFFDVTPALRRCPASAQCCFPVDPHWNAAGHRLVGDTLASSFPLGRP